MAEIENIKIFQKKTITMSLDFKNGYTVDTSVANI